MENDKMQEPAMDARKQEMDAQEQDIDALTALLDEYTRAGESRIRVEVVEGQSGLIAHEHHHGRCDIGSPWAKGTAFDVIED